MFVELRSFFFWKIEASNVGHLVYARTHNSNFILKFITLTHVTPQLHATPAPACPMVTLVDLLNPDQIALI